MYHSTYVYEKESFIVSVWCFYLRACRRWMGRVSRVIHMQFNLQKQCNVTGMKLGFFFFPLNALKVDHSVKIFNLSSSLLLIPKKSYFFKGSQKICQSNQHAFGNI